MENPMGNFSKLYLREWIENIILLYFPYPLVDSIKNLLNEKCLITHYNQLLNKIFALLEFLEVCYEKNGGHLRDIRS